MISPNVDETTVVLNIPMRAEYVSIARLTAAGVANRVGFDIETIEDIKVSLSEVCNRIINARSMFGSDGGGCKIEFIITADGLGINFYVDHADEIGAFVSGDRQARDDISAGALTYGADALPDEIRVKEYEEQLQLSLITLLMDEFKVNPFERCLVSMKKFLE